MKHLARTLLALLLGLPLLAAGGETSLNDFGSAPTYNLIAPILDTQCMIYSSALSAWTNSSSCGGGGGSSAFSALTSGTNASAAMLVGSGATLGPTGTGTISANLVNGLAVPTSQACLGSNSSGQLIGCTLPTGANPTASVGTTAVNGSATTYMKSDASPPISLSIAPIWTAIHQWLQAIAANVSADAIEIYNTAVASSGNQRFSPALHFQGQGWGTTGAASQAVDCFLDIEPLQAATATADLYIKCQNNGGGYVTVAHFQNGSTPTLNVTSVVSSSSSTVSGLFDTKAVNMQGSKPTVTGCSNTGTLGGAHAGSYVSGTSGTCSVTFTLANSASNQFYCQAHDETTAADYTQIATSSGTAVAITGTTVSGDVIRWNCAVAF